MGSGRKAAGAIVGAPALLQIRFEGSSKWPSDLDAMGAAKCAMLIQLAGGIERMRRNGDKEACGFDGPMRATPTYLDLGYRGYSWRIMIRADRELRMLGSLRDPTPAARSLRTALHRRHVLSATHHSMMHAVHTRHPSSGPAVRLARRWTAAHMLSDALPAEAVELLVASAYADPAPLVSPATVVSGFIRFLRLLASHDWAREPLIVDPQGIVGAEDRALIRSRFDSSRGPDLVGGPPMYVVSPGDCGIDGNGGGPAAAAAEEEEEEAGEGLKLPGCGDDDDGGGRWAPGITHTLPERVFLSRAVALAGRSEKFLARRLLVDDDGRRGGSGGDPDEWSPVFSGAESSLASYGALLAVDPDLVVDPGCSTAGGNFTVRRGGGLRFESPFTVGAARRHAGPKPLRKNLYKNLSGSKDSILHGWQPVEAVVAKLRRKFGGVAAFFYNDLAPDVIAVLWRPDALRPQPFSAARSERKAPVEIRWQADGLVVTSLDDVLREIRHVARGVVVDVRRPRDDDGRPTEPVLSRSAKKLRASKS